MTIMLGGRRPNNAREIFESLVDISGSAPRLRPDMLEAVETLIREGKLGLDPTGCRNSPGHRAAKTVRLQEWYRAGLGKRYASVMEREQVSLRESVDLMEAPAGAVTSAILNQITKQLIFSEVRRQFDLEANVFAPLFPVIPSDIKGTEIVPSVTNVDPDAISDVGEGMPYPAVGVDEEYFTLPAKQKSGGIISLTREAVRFDKTNTVVDQARSIGGAMGANKENKCIDVLLGATNNYSRNGTASNTFLTSGSYVNNVTGLPLDDWQAVNELMQVLGEILDPTTSEPLAVNMRPQDLVVMPYRALTAGRILTATGTRSHENPAGGSRTDELQGGNPIAGMGLRLLHSQRLYQRAQSQLGAAGITAAVAKHLWFLGTIAEAFAWYEAWPLELVEQGRDSDAGFERDIEHRFKGSFYGVAVTREARKIARGEDTAVA